ncbi:MAG: hypothetical protein ACKO8I_09950 [Cyanobacteriota bacterium]
MFAGFLKLWRTPMSSRAPALTGVLASAGFFLAAVAPAQAVTTWNWSFSSPSNRSGSGTFTTADVTPTAGVDIQILGISGSISDGSTYNITSLNSQNNNIFRWDGSSSSPFLVQNRQINPFAGISFTTTNNGNYNLYARSGTFSAVDSLDTPENSYIVDNSLVQPVLAPPANAVPGPLPLLGAAAAFGASRRLRQRIKLHKSSRSAEARVVFSLAPSLEAGLFVVPSHALQP